MASGTAASSVKLTIFSAYKRPTWVAMKDGAQPEFLYGASEYRLDKSNERILISFDNVPIDPAQTAPAPGFMALYGYRDSIEEVERRRREARSLGLEFKQAELVMDVGKIFAGILDFDSLKEVRFANLNRMSAHLQRDIYDFFVSKVEAEGGNVDQDMGRIRQIAQRPDLLANLLSEDRRFKHLEILVVPVEDSALSPTPGDPKRIRQVAFVRPKARVVEMGQSQDGDLLLLPNGFSVKPLTEAEKDERAAPTAQTAPAAKAKASAKARDTAMTT